MEPDKKHDQLFEAIKKEDVATVRELILYGAPINQPNPKYANFTALHLAVKIGNKEIIETLLIKNANVDILNTEEQTPLHAAIESCGENTDIVELLLSRGADVNAKDKDGCTALHYVCKSADLSNNMKMNLLKIILKYKPDINATDNEGKTALHEACGYGLDFLADGLLEHNGDPNLTDSLGLTPIFRVNILKNPAIIQLLLDKGANTLHTTPDGQTLLHVFLKEKIWDFRCNEFIESIICKDLEILAIRDDQGRSALHVANQEAKSAILVALLIRYGADIALLDHHNHDPIYYTAEKLLRARDNLRTLKISEENVFETWIDTYFFAREVSRIFKEHMLALECLGMNVNEKSYKSLVQGIVNHSDGDFEEESFCSPDVPIFKAKCNEEVDHLKKEKIPENNVSFYQFIKRSAGDAARYAHNLQMRMRLQDKHFDSEFPTYIGLVKYRFAQGLAWNRVVQSVPQVVYLKIFIRVPKECIDKIFTYLNFDELKVFVGVLKQDYEYTMRSSRTV